MLKDIYRKHADRFLISLIPVVIFGVMAPLRACMIQILIDSDNIGELLEKFPLVAAFSLGVLFFEWLGRSRQAIVVRGMEMDLRNRLMHRLFHISANQFEKRSRNYYLDKFGTDIRMILEDGVNSVYDMILQAVHMTTAVIYLLCTEPFILPAAAVICTGQLAVSNLLKKKASLAKAKYMRAQEIYLDGVGNDLGGHRVIRAFDAVKQVLEKQDNLSDYVSWETECAARTLYWGKAQASFVGSGALLIALWSCMLLVAAGRITFGEAAAIIYMMRLILTSCKKLVNDFLRFRALEKVTAELEGLLSGESDHDNKESMGAELREIRLDNVSQKISDDFSLEHLTLTFEKGGKYAIVGKSGSGKTSLLKLLTEYGSDYTGQAFMNGQELAELNRESILHVSPVSEQQPYIFKDTVFNNVALYQNYSRDQVMEALQEAGIYDTVRKLPKGLDQEIREDKKGFSGADLQRIALARLLLRKKPAAFVDEITSGLDNAAAYEMEKSLLEADMMIINITNRYNKTLMQKYDEIIVMDAGRIAERGSFDELMEKKEEFYRLYKIFNK